MRPFRAAPSGIGQSRCLRTLVYQLRLLPALLAILVEVLPLMGFVFGREIAPNFIGLGAHVWYFPLGVLILWRLLSGGPPRG